MAPTTSSMKTHAGGRDGPGGRRRRPGGGGEAKKKEGKKDQKPLKNRMDFLDVNVKPKKRSARGRSGLERLSSNFFAHDDDEDKDIDEDDEYESAAEGDEGEEEEEEVDEAKFANYRSIWTCDNAIPTETDVIKAWFTAIFQPVEKSCLVLVTDFHFETLKKPKSNGSSSIEDSSRQCKVHIKRAEVDLLNHKQPKHYSLVIKVMPTDDRHRWQLAPEQFMDLLRFSKEVDVYEQVIRSMVIFDEKRYPSACVEPPVPKCFLSQFDAQNDVVVLENLESQGYRHYHKQYIGDYDHCRVVLRRLAHFHAISTLIQRDSEMSLCELYPFVSESVLFRARFDQHVARAKSELVKYVTTSGKKGLVPDGAKCQDVIDEHFENLFVKLVELRSRPIDRRFSVLNHGRLDPCNIVFQYDETSGRPICAKFLDFADMSVSSPVNDLAYFIHRSVLPEVASAHHADLIQHYLRSHEEAISAFGMHGFEIEMETLLAEYKANQDYGAMMACSLRTGLYALQCMNKKDSNPAPLNNGPTNSCRPAAKDTSSDSTNDEDNDDSLSSSDDLFTLDPTIGIDKLRIDHELVPFDLRLHSYLSGLAKTCSCPCAIGDSRELMISELTSDSLEDLRLPQGRRRQNPGLLDCGGGGGGGGGGSGGSGGGVTNVKKLIMGLISSPSKDDQDSPGLCANSNGSKKIKEDLARKA